jgi:hypothetical protein
MKTLFEQAKEKVENSPVLSEDADFILADWPEGEEHLRWVVEADESEILEWVEAGK